MGKNCIVECIYGQKIVLTRSFCCYYDGVGHLNTCRDRLDKHMYADYACRYLGGDGTEDLTLYRISGHLYTVTFDSNLGDLEVRPRPRTPRKTYLRCITHPAVLLELYVRTCHMYIQIMLFSPREDATDLCETARAES